MVEHKRLALWALALLSTSPSVPRAFAGEAAKLLPAGMDVVLSINCRQFRQEAWVTQSEPVQDFLKHWRSYLRGNEAEFDKYVRGQRVFQKAGMKEQEDLLQMAQTLKGRHDTVGLDVLNDIDRV